MPEPEGRQKDERNGVEYQAYKSDADPSFLQFQRPDGENNADQVRWLPPATVPDGKVLRVFPEVGQ
jgi:hypothetical protein